MTAGMEVTKLEFDRKGIRALMDSPEMAEAERLWAEDVAHWVNVANVTTTLAGRDPLAEAGDNGTDADGTYARVDSLDPGWHLIEYGTYSMAPLSPFRIGAEAAGFRWRDGGPA